MRTHTVRHEPHPALDAALVERLRPLSIPVRDAGEAIRIGVEDADGELYRVIETSSLVEAVRVFEALNDLGLEPRRRHRPRKDSPMRVFGHPPGPR